LIDPFKLLQAGMRLLCIGEVELCVGFYVGACLLVELRWRIRVAGLRGMLFLYIPRVLGSCEGYGTRFTRTVCEVFW